MSERRMELLQKYPAIKGMDRNNVLCNNRRPFYFGQVDGNHKYSSTNLTSPLFLRSGIMDENDDPKIVTKEPIETEKNVDCQLMTTPEVENQPATAIEKHDQPVLYDDSGKDYFTYGDLLKMNVKSIPFLVEKLLPAGAIIILGGESQVGKSLLYQQLAIAIIHGDESFLGYKLNSINRRVLIINTEDDEVVISYNILKLTSTRNADLSLSDELILFSHNFNLLNRLEVIMNKYQFDLVVVDPLSDNLLGDMNQSNITRQYLNKFQFLAKKHKCTFLIVHHTGKSKDKKEPNKAQLLGSVGIEGKARQVIMLSHDKNYPNMKIISIVKGNYLSETEKSKQIFLKFDPLTLLCKEYEYEQPVQSSQSNIASGSFSSRNNRPGRQKDMKLFNQAIKLDSEGMTQVEIAKIVQRDKSTVCKWLKEFKNRKPYDFSKVDDVD